MSIYTRLIWMWGNWYFLFITLFLWFFGIFQNTRGSCNISNFIKYNTVTQWRLVYNFSPPSHDHLSTSSSQTIGFLFLQSSLFSPNSNPITTRALKPATATQAAAAILVTSINQPHEGPFNRQLLASSWVFRVMQLKKKKKKMMKNFTRSIFSSYG